MAARWLLCPHCVLSNLTGLLREQLCRTVFLLAFVAEDTGQSRVWRHWSVRTAAPSPLGAGLSPWPCSVPPSPAHTRSPGSKASGQALQRSFHP